MEQFPPGICFAMHTPQLFEQSARPGVMDLLRSILTPVLLYADARLHIAKLESREALQAGGVIIALLFSLAVAYMGGLVAVALWISQNWWQGSLLPAVVVIVAGHLVLAAAGAVWLARSLRHRDLFHATRKEFMEDKRWLLTDPASRS